MNMHRRRPIQQFIGYLLVFLLVVTALVFTQQRMQAQTALDDVVPAVVRIVAINCNIGCIPQAVGSGAIIHPSGIILTALHVVVEDKNNPLSPPHTDFLIEMTDRARNPVQTRYRARVAALAPDVDLALLQIYFDEQRRVEFDANEDLALPTLPIGDNDRVSLGSDLQILGYPLVAGDTIDYTTTQVGGFEDRTIRVRETLSPGNSGGPALAEQDGRLAIVGVVSRNRGESGELALLQEVISLDRLIWMPDARQGWLSDLKIEANAEQINVQSAVQTVGVPSDSVRLLAYLFDARTGAAVQTVAHAETNLIRTRSGQIVLAQDVPVDGFIMESALTLSVDLDELGATSADLRVHLVLWDGKAGRALWQSARPLSVSQSVAIAPTATSTSVLPATPTASLTDTSLPTDTPTATETPTATSTDTPISTLTVTWTPTATETHSASPIDTPTNNVKSMFEPTTPDPKAITAITPTSTSELTITVAPSMTPTSAVPQIRTTSNMNVRAGPGTNYPVISSLPVGSTANITGRNQAGDWWQVAVGNDVLGWIYALFVETSGPVEAVAIAQQIPTPPTTQANPGSSLQAGTTRVVEGITFVYVPAGEFVMGSTEAEIDAAFEQCQQYRGDTCQRLWYAVEAPAHTVYLDGYWIGRTEVTNAQFRAFIEADGYTTERYWSEEGWAWRVENQITEPALWQESNFTGDQQPVVGLSWHEADAYSRWLAETSSLPIRLPTEAEWEKAARGPESRIYPWGDAWDPSRANYCDKRCSETFDDATWGDVENDDGYARTSPVGSFPFGASPYGALDMVGNVWEWTGDWYDNYASSPARNPTGPDGGSIRVLRGGSWHYVPSGLRGAYRGKDYPGSRTDRLGVRVVLATSTAP
jgi:formylglycine-generating enzyme required for sulfatase activity